MKTIKLTFLQLTLSLFVLSPLISSAQRNISEQMKPLALELSRIIDEKGFPAVAVVEFTEIDKSKSDFGVYLSGQLSSEMSRLNRSFEIAERTKLDRILEEQHLGTSGLFRDSDAIRLGELVNANAVITGTMIMVDKLKLELTTMIFDVEKGILVESIVYTIQIPKRFSRSGIAPTQNNIPNRRVDASIKQKRNRFHRERDWSTGEGWIELGLRIPHFVTTSDLSPQYYDREFQVSNKPGWSLGLGWEIGGNNFRFVTGIDFSRVRLDIYDARINPIGSNTISKVEVEYESGLSHLSIPLVAKFCTNQIGYLTFGVQSGLVFTYLANKNRIEKVTTLTDLNNVPEQFVSNVNVDRLDLLWNIGLSIDIELKNSDLYRLTMGRNIAMFSDVGFLEGNHNHRLSFWNLSIARVF